MALDRPIGGVRLTSLIWHTIQPPNWMLDRGWALTPEMAGVTDEDRRAGRSDRPEAYLRRQDGALRMVLGGRYLGPSGGPPVGVDVTLDGRIVGSFRTRPEPRWFVQWLEVPEGTAAGDGPYATLAVDARTPSGSAAGALVGFEQFDAAWGDDPIFAFVKGWHEAESDPATGRSWRWTSGASVIDIRGGWGERTLVISGESPLRYFSQPPRVTVRAGAQVLKAFSPGSDFTERIAIPAGALGPAAGRVTIETDQVFSPSQSGSPDRRTLGLRLYSVELQ
jgi:hypothetical protein